MIPSPPAKAAKGAKAAGGSAPSKASPSPDRGIPDRPTLDRQTLDRQTLVFSLLLMAAVLVSYNPITHNGFINYDDDGYITDNPQVKAGLTWATVKWAFTTYDQANWHPLTWLSHALDCQMFGLNPAGHHRECPAARAQRCSSVSAATERHGIPLAQPDGGGFVCASSHQCRVGSVGGRAEERAEHAVLSARSVCLRLVRAPAWLGRYAAWPASLRWRCSRSRR